MKRCKVYLHDGSIVLVTYAVFSIQTRNQYTHYRFENNHGELIAMFSADVINGIMVE